MLDVLSMATLRGDFASYAHGYSLNARREAQQWRLGTAPDGEAVRTRACSKWTGKSKDAV